MIQGFRADSDGNSATEDILFLDEDNEEAHRFDLISAYIDNEVTVEERKLVQHWLDHDAAAKKLYQQLLGLQTNLKQIPVPVTIASDQLAEQVLRKVDGQRFGVHIGYSFEGRIEEGELIGDALGSAGGLRRIQDFNPLVSFKSLEGHEGQHEHSLPPHRV